VTLLPLLAVPIENRRGDLVVLRLTGPEPGRTLGLAYRPGSPLKARFAKVAEVIGAAARGALAAPSKPGAAERRPPHARARGAR
jgi:LysR family hydrogen peroxide-inducible transcriptional activator